MNTLQHPSPLALGTVLFHFLPKPKFRMPSWDQFCVFSCYYNKLFDGNERKSFFWFCFREIEVMWYMEGRANRLRLTVEFGHSGPGRRKSRPEPEVLGLLLPARPTFYKLISLQKRSPTGRPVKCFWIPCSDWLPAFKTSTTNAFKFNIVSFFVPNYLDEFNGSFTVTCSWGYFLVCLFLIISNWISFCSQTFEYDLIVFWNI